MVGRADVQLAELPITIMSRQGPLSSLAPDRIRVREGRRTRVVESVATAAETPLTVGLLMDVSGSMQRSLPDLQEAAIRFLQTILGEGDRAFLVTFDSHARLLQPATSDIALLHDQIMKMRPSGQTALHDAIALGLLQFEGIKGRRAMVLFTDGADVTSEYTAAEVNELARRVSVPVHVFAAPPSGIPGASLTVVHLASGLRRIAQATGGTSHTVQDLDELPRVFARIEAALRAQVLAFIRTDPATRDNEWRAIDVSVTGEGLDVYAPEGYYATW
jgi:VWFA-related protein